MFLCLAAAVASIGVAPAEGASPGCDQFLNPYTGTSPRLVRDHVSFQGVDIPINVLLPTDYASGREYPVLYLLHGGGDDQDAWLATTDLVEFTDALPAEQQVIVVMPNEFLAVGLYSDWRDGTESWETFHIETVIPYIDSTYNTIPGRAHRAIGGYSGGGFGAMHYATRHPDLFVAGASFSGLVDITSPEGIAIVQAAILVNVYCSGDGEPTGPWGDFATQEVYWHGHNPTDLASNLRGMSVFLSAGNGLPCNQRDAGRAVTAFPLADVEPVARRMAESFSRELTEASVTHTTHFPACGIHDYPYFGEGLHLFWPQMLAAFGTAAPSSFDYRTPESPTSVWDWTFTADPLRAAEFLDVTDASSAGLVLTGSGTQSVTTASYFTASQVVSLSGAVEPSVVADPAGRITFHVDLGPTHNNQQYTPAARVLEAAGNYFTTKNITFVAT